MTSTPFPDWFASHFTSRLGLNATSYDQPSSNASALIPFNETWSGFNQDIRDETPAGGYYSSLRDMRTVGESMLNFTYLSPAQTRRWMKPGSFSASANFSVGHPWEIVRAPNPNMTSWLYTKGGYIGMYSSEFVLMPEFDAGFNVLAAGANAFNDAQTVTAILASVLHPAFEEAAKEEATHNYAGVYSAARSGGNSSITIVVDEYPGLAVTHWLNNGTNMMEVLGEIETGVTNASELAGLSLRLYPSNLVTRAANGSITRTGWRAVYELLPPEPSPFFGTCVSWLGIDQYTYGGVGLDEFVFDLGADGRAVAIEPGCSEPKCPGQSHRARRDHFSRDCFDCQCPRIDL